MFAPTMGNVVPRCVEPESGSSGRRLERLPGGTNPAFHQLLCARAQVVGQQVGDPDEAAAAVAYVEYLPRPVVVGVGPVDDRPRQASLVVIAVDKPLAHDRAVQEGHDPVGAVEAAVDRESPHESLVQGAPVAESVPYLLGARIDERLLANGRHGCSSSAHTAQVAVITSAAASTAVVTSRAWAEPWAARLRYTPRKAAAPLVVPTSVAVRIRPLRSAA